MIIQNNYQITAIGVYTPKKKLTNFDFEKMVETSDEWIVKRTGIKERHMSAEDEFSSDMAIKAVQNLLDNYPVTVDDVDLMMVSGLVTDHLAPSVSALVAGHFGIHGGTYDFYSGCAAFAYGLITANAFLASGMAKKILIISSETLTKVVDYTDRNTCILFGDAATATLIERSDSPKPFISAFGTEGTLADKVYCSHASPVINGAPVAKARLIQQNGPALYEFVVKNITCNVSNLIDEAGLSASDIDWFVPHSANLRMIDVMRERLGIEKERMLTSVERYGNTSSASIPLALSLALKDGRLKRGDRVLIYGFGSGIAYAGEIIEW